MITKGDLFQKGSVFIKCYLGSMLVAGELRGLGSSAEVQEKKHISCLFGVRGCCKPRCAAQSSLRGDASASGGLVECPGSL